MPNLLMATAASLPRLAPDCRALIPALHAEGWHVSLAVWDDPAVQWSDADAIVVRSIWDYWEKRESFLGWLDQLERTGVPVANPVPVIRHNLDKRYLADLSDAGVVIVPTEYAASRAAAREAVATTSWAEVVIKPTVNAAGHNTHRVDVSDEDALNSALDSALRAGEIMIQRFIPSIVHDGEWSLTFFHGELSHAVRKRAAPGEFRVQDDWGGTVHIEPPPDAALRAAASVAEAAAAVSGFDGALPYARIDGVVENDRFLVMEAELIEPELFLRAHPAAPARCAAALTRFLT